MEKYNTSQSVKKSIQEATPTAEDRATWRRISKELPLRASQASPRQ